MIRVLVVDDHAIVRSGLVQLLATTDDLEAVGEAADGEEAVELAARLQPDVVLMDLAMPGTDGLTATRLLLARSPDTHVLVLTTFGERDRILDVLRAGAEGYLLKNAAPESILSGIRQLVEGGSPLDPRAARVLLTSTRPDPSPDDPLTARERQVLAMVSEGLPNKTIARQLGITERTVKVHLTSIFHRLGVNGRTQAALWAQRHLDLSAHETGAAPRPTPYDSPST